MPDSLKKIFYQEKPVGVIAMISAIVGISLVRTFLENFSSVSASDPFTSGYSAFTHFIYFYFSIILSLALLLFFLTKVALPKILGLMVTLFPVIWLGPLIDLIITSGKGWKIGYNILEPAAIIPAFFTFFGRLQTSGVTPGIRIEIFIILAAIFIFTYYQTKNLFLSALGFIGAYCIFFIYAATPSIIALPWLLKNSQTDYSLFFSGQFSNSWPIAVHLLTLIPKDLGLLFQQQSELFLARVFWLGTVLQSLLVFKFAMPAVWQAWKKNLRLERVLYYCTIGILGMFLYPGFLNPEKLLNLPNILALAIFFLLIALNAWFAVIVNDEADIEIDKISNPDRPLIKNTISLDQSRTIGFVLFIYILSGVILLNYVTLYLLLMFQAVYFLYSAQPLRLKRFIFFSSPLLGLNALAIAMAGFFLVSPDQHTVAFPKNALWFILFGFAIIANIKDIKDFAGDKHANIQTLPTMFGLKKAKLLIGLACAIFLLLFSFFSGSAYLFFATWPFAIFLVYLVNLENYQEIYLFYLFFAYMILVFSTLFR